MLTCRYSTGSSSRPRHPTSKRSSTTKSAPKQSRKPPNDRPTRPSHQPNSRQSPATKQTTFPTPLPNEPRIAIIGGGMAGLSCATELASLGIRSTVFDTGEHGVGGRMGTRCTVDGSLRNPSPAAWDENVEDDLIFDHACQFFTATSQEFRAIVTEWESAGIIRQWRDSVGVFDFKARDFTPLSCENGSPRYTAVGGMRRLADGIAARAAQTGFTEIRRPMWVSSARPEPSGWRLMANGRQQGTYDAVVIAHNGKCANRLSATMGIPAVHGQLRRLKLSANWVVMVAFERPIDNLPGDLQGAFIEGCDTLSWVGNNSAKLLSPTTTTSSLSSTSTSLKVSLSANQESNCPTMSKRKTECWTLISTQSYGKRNKVPQEQIPEEVSKRVIHELIAAFAASIGLSAPSDMPPIVYAKAQLWGAALPLNSPRIPCIWDAKARVGVVGDWVLGGGSIENAALSGRALATLIHRQARVADDGDKTTTMDMPSMSCGLGERFTPIKAAQIGEFKELGSDLDAFTRNESFCAVSTAFYQQHSLKDQALNASAG